MPKFPEPGCWRYQPSGDCDGEHYGIDHFVMEGDEEIARPPDEARARLMAAAPGMLALLKRAVAERIDDAWLTQAREVIAATECGPAKPLRDPAPGWRLDQASFAAEEADAYIAQSGDEMPASVENSLRAILRATEHILADARARAAR
jgi:hypothetical protein